MGIHALTTHTIDSALGITDEQKKKLQDLDSQFQKQAAKSAEKSASARRQRQAVAAGTPIAKGDIAK